jgi:hypothetical protein
MALKDGLFRIIDTCFDVSLEVSKGNLIAMFKLTIMRALFLDSIIGQVHQSVT